MRDKYSNLAGTVSEVQDGGLVLPNTSSGPRTIVLGTSASGPADAKTLVVREKDTAVLFGADGSLIRGMYEAIGGGSIETYLYRIGTKSAILYGVGTDDQLVGPTSIETVLKDGDAANVYYVRYTKPLTLGPDFVIGRLQIKNAIGDIVYDNNPGGVPTDLGEVIVGGAFDGGENIGSVLDIDDYICFRTLAKDETVVTDEALGEYSGSLTTVTLAESTIIPGSVVVKIEGTQVDSTKISYVPEGHKVVIAAGLDSGTATADYLYDDEPLYDLREGSDGTSPSKMEMYEALDRAYGELEADEIDYVIPMEVFLDDKNIVKNDDTINTTLVQLSTDTTIPEGQRYPVAGSSGDALGKIFIDEYEGSKVYFWDIDDDDEAEIFPSVGDASSTTKCDGTALSSVDFVEVNFGWQLANFCWSLSVNDNECYGVIGTSMPNTNSMKDIAIWAGKLPILSSTGTVTSNGSGLLGNKFVSGTVARDPGFFATYSDNLPVGRFATNADIIKDRSGNPIDIGKYLDIVCMPVIHYNEFEPTGYQASGAALFAGFASKLPTKSATTNKIVYGVGIPFKLYKPKLNALCGAHFVALREKEGVLRWTDDVTAARSTSDFAKRSTCKIVSAAIDLIRTVAQPYIGEPNTAMTREAMQTSMKKELADFQTAGNISRFDLKVTATATQQITGDALVELTLVPAFELRKITILTSLAAE